MRVFYRTEIVNIELEVGKTLEVVPCKAFFELQKQKGDKDYELFLDGNIISGDISIIDCSLGGQLTIRQNDRKMTYSVRTFVGELSTENSLIYDQFLCEYNAKEESDVDSIKSGKLRLYAVDQSISIQDYTLIFDKLFDSLSSFILICNKPKSHLKATNEVRPIETVKRIGYESIPYLSAHSEDWLARTARGLKPARLFSRVEDDEFHIYENLVTKTLLEEVIQFLAKAERELRNQLGQISGIVNSNVQVESFGFDSSFQKAVSEILAYHESDDDTYLNSAMTAEKFHKQAAILLKKYKALRDSKLYKLLKKAQRVKNPLRETNILMMDKNYNKIFNLWKLLKKQHSQSEQYEKVIPIENTYAAYMKFCKSLFSYAAYVLNFEDDGNGRYYRASDMIEVILAERQDMLQVTVREKQIRRLKISNGLNVPIPANSQYGGFQFDGDTLSWDSDVTSEDIDRFSSLQYKSQHHTREYHAERKSYNSLKQALEQHNRSYKDPNKSIFLVLPMIVDIENDNRQKFKLYMEKLAHLVRKEENFTKVIVALPKCDENEQKITSYSKDVQSSVMFIPLSLFDINSYRRIQNLLLRTIVSFDRMSCPHCGGKMRLSSNQLICDACNQLTITSTKCSNQKCKSNYKYLSYNTSTETIAKMQNIKENNFFQWDSLFQYKDIVDMSVINGKIHTICPYCKTIE